MGKFIFKVEKERVKDSLEILPIVRIQNKYSCGRVNEYSLKLGWLSVSVTFKLRRNRFEHELVVFAEDYADAVDGIINHESVKNNGYAVKYNTIRNIGKSGIGQVWTVRIFKDK
jgi:hypothetical protein